MIICFHSNKWRVSSAYLWLCTFHWEALPVSCHQSEQNQTRSSQLHRSPNPGLERTSRIFNIETLHVSTITDGWLSPLNTSETQSLKGLSIDLWGALKASIGQENKKPKEEEIRKNNKETCILQEMQWLIYLWFSSTEWITCLTHWTSEHYTKQQLKQTLPQWMFVTVTFIEGCDGCFTNLLQQAGTRVPGGELWHWAPGGQIFSWETTGWDVEHIRLLEEIKIKLNSEWELTSPMGFTS